MSEETKKSSARRGLNLNVKSRLTYSSAVLTLALRQTKQGLTPLMQDISDNNPT